MERSMLYAVRSSAMLACARGSGLRSTAPRGRRRCAPRPAARPGCVPGGCSRPDPGRCALVGTGAPVPTHLQDVCRGPIVIRLPPTILLLPDFRAAFATWLPSKGSGCGRSLRAPMLAGSAPGSCRRNRPRHPARAAVRDGSKRGARGWRRERAG